MMTINHGWKFLTPYGSTIYKGEDFVYSLPQPGQKWGPWIEHPDPAEPDGISCGPGRLHVMKKLSADYAPRGWWPWYVEYSDCDVIGESWGIVSVRKLRLRRLNANSFWRLIRLGYCQGSDLWGANLQEASLWGADLQGANLRAANLREANLRGASLQEANLRGAKLWGAILRGVNLQEANLRGANLRGADFQGADLRRADLWGADLRGTNLWGAHFEGADLRRADLRGANLWGAHFEGANLGKQEPSEDEGEGVA